MSNRKDKASFLPHNFMPIFERNLFEFLDGNQTIFKNIPINSLYFSTRGELARKESVWKSTYILDKNGNKVKDCTSSSDPQREVETYTAF